MSNRNHPIHTNHSLRQSALQRTLQKTRARLPLPLRVLSIITHAPLIDYATSFLEKTFFRPAVIIGAATTYIIATAATYYLATQHGYAFNYLISVAALAPGALIGALKK